MEPQTNCLSVMISMDKDIKRITEYSNSYLNDYGFEQTMVLYRQKLLLTRLEELRPTIVVEIGCGIDLLYDKWLKRDGLAACWIIVEPSRQFYKHASFASLPNLFLINDFFENTIDQVSALLPRPPDMVICSGLLHEVPSAQVLLVAMRKIMGEDTRLHINVPNSQSLHRRLALSMGLIADTKSMSDRNISLLQHRVYDMSSLEADLTNAGLQVVEKGGYLIKPFTHGQMEKIAPVLGQPVLDGLYQLGCEMPELASEIFVEARRDSRV